MSTPAFQLHQQEERLCCRLEGEFTLDAATRFKDAFAPYLETKQCAMVILDLEHVRFMDSTGIGCLVVLNTRLQGLGVPLYLLKPSMQVRKVLELVQLSKFFTMIDDPASLSLPEPPCGQE